MPQGAGGPLRHTSLEPLLPASTKETISYAYGIDARDPAHPRAWTDAASSVVRLLADKKAGTAIGSPGNPARMANHSTLRSIIYNDGHAKWQPDTDAVDPNAEDDTVGAPGAADYRAWWSDPPYYGE